jgi:hypothetical protein
MSSFPISTFPFTQDAASVVIWMQYAFNTTVGRVNAQFLDASGSVLGIQYVDLPEDVYASWTTSDDVILDYVATELGITFV